MNIHSSSILLKQTTPISNLGGFMKKSFISLLLIFIIFSKNTFASNEYDTLSQGNFYKIPSEMLTHHICPYLEYDDLRNVDQSSKYFNRKILKEAFPQLNKDENIIKNNFASNFQKILYAKYIGKVKSDIKSCGFIQAIEKIEPKENRPYVIFTLKYDMEFLNQIVSRDEYNLFSPQGYEGAAGSHFYRLAITENLKWGYFNNGASIIYQNLYSFLKKTEFVYIVYTDSFKFLPLFHNKTFTINYGLYNYPSKRPVPYLLTEEDYKNIGDLLLLNYLENFTLIPDHAHERNDAETIRPLAEALANPKITNLKTFTIPRYIGRTNLRILEEGLLRNPSITPIYGTQVYDNKSKV